MSREWFVDTNFRQKSRDLLTTCDEIVEDYQGQGLRLTLRQLYYQLVTRNTIVNSERSYQNLSALVSDGRLAGMLDWDAIEDRVRVARVPTEYDNLTDLVDAAVRSYRLPRWKGQENYVELWVEKDALAGVLQPLARRFHVTMMVNRGYSSQSAMYEAAKRFERCCDEGQLPHLLYLGDHDPSGEDMVRDIKTRFTTFRFPVNVKKIALTTAQVEQYEPPPNPAKLTDPRAAAYVAIHGPQSWEVDALPPNVLTQIITTELSALVDQELVDAIMVQEEKDKAALRKAAVKITGAA